MKSAPTLSFPVLRGYQAKQQGHPPAANHYADAGTVVLIRGSGLTSAWACVMQP